MNQKTMNYYYYFNIEFLIVRIMILKVMMLLNYNLSYVDFVCLSIYQNFHDLEKFRLQFLLKKKKKKEKYIKYIYICMYYVYKLNNGVNLIVFLFITQ